MRQKSLANRDIRVACMEQDVKFWQIAMQLGISAETFTRRMRTELDEEEKAKIFRAMAQVLDGH